ncbi:MAG TPA: type II toxin-antitoxin system VapC family toxin [Bryobacteraceae bacterium]|nr:type II toxin-antitoxin system VapC family toxin [Bryobacteraceae bacterium]
MKLLLDTHLLLWAAGKPDRLPAEARTLIGDPENEPVFSSASLWEIAIKRGLGRSDFQVDARLLRRGLLDNGYLELAITGEHAVATDGLPPLHKDPFDRLLVAQSMVEGITLLTTDSLVAQYPAPVRKV